MPASPDTAQDASPDFSLGAPLYSGTFEFTLDQKKRLTIPTGWRSNSLKELYIVKASTRKCLLAMPREVLRALGNKVGQLQGASPSRQQTFRRRFFAAVATCGVDSQGRVLLSDDLCRYAGIERDIVLTGNDDSFEIWSPAEVQRDQEETDPLYNTTMADLGL